jgi:histone H3/H4
MLGIYDDAIAAGAAAGATAEPQEEEDPEDIDWGVPLGGGGGAHLVLLGLSEEEQVGEDFSWETSTSRNAETSKDLAGRPPATGQRQQSIIGSTKLLAVLEQAMLVPWVQPQVALLLLMHNSRGTCHGGIRLGPDLMRHIFSLCPVRISTTAVRKLRDAAEHFLVRVCEDSCLNSLHRRSTVVWPLDVKLALELAGTSRSNAIAGVVAEACFGVASNTAPLLGAAPLLVEQLAASADPTRDVRRPRAAAASVVRRYMYSL